MSCLIQYNSKGKIVSVLDKQGNISEVFTKINSIPTISAEEAVEIYKGTLSSNIKEGDKISFQSDKGNVFDSYKGALKDSSKNVKVISKSQETGEITNLATISASTNPYHEKGLINDMIKKDLIEEYTDNVAGEKTYIPFGESELRRVVSTQLADSHIRSNNLGKYTYNLKEDGTFTMEKRESVKDMTDAEIVEKASQDVADSKFAREVAQTINAHHSLDSNTTEYSTHVTQMTEENLRNQLTELLSKMGVKLMHIEEYKNNFKNRNGVDVSAEAFADIANSVIAFHGEDIDTSVLMEETFHFIIEGMGKTEVAEALEEIVNTELYQEMSDVYREQYKNLNPNMTETQIEELVRKEILAKQVVENLTQEQTKGNFITEFFNKIKDFIKGLIVNADTQQHIKNITESVAKLVVRKNVESSINMEQLKKSRYLMFALNNGTFASSPETIRLKEIAKKFLEKAEVSERVIRNEKNIGGSSRLKKIRRAKEMIDSAIESTQVQVAMSELMDVIGSKIDFLNDSFKTAEKEGLALGREESSILEQLKEVYKPALNSLLAATGKNSDFTKMSKRINDKLMDIAKAEGREANFNNNTMAELVEKIIRRSTKASEFTDEADLEAFIKKTVDEVNKHDKDTGSLYMYYGQITHARDPYLNLGGAIIADLQNDMEFNSTFRLKSFVTKIGNLLGTPEALNKLLSNKGDKIASYYNFEAFDKDIADAKKAAHKHALEKDGWNKKQVEEAMKTLDKYYNNEITYQEMSDAKVDINGDPQSIATQVSETREVAYNEHFKMNTLDIIERRMKKEYYVKQAEDFNKYGLHDYTKVYLADESSSRAEVISRGSDESGEFWSTRALKNEMESITRTRKMAESPYNATGRQLKEGLKLITEMEYQNLSDRSVAHPVNKGLYVMMDETVQPTKEAIIAYDLNKMKAIRAEIREAEAQQGTHAPMFKNEQLSESFLRKLEEMEKRDPAPTRKELKDFVLYNMNIDITGDFWDNLTEGPTNYNLAEETIKELSGQERDDFQGLYMRKKTADLERDVLIKSYRDSKDGTNTKVTHMGTDVLEAIMDLTETIDQLELDMRATKAYASKIEAKTYNSNPEVENTVNQNWYSYLNDHGIEYSPSNVQEIYEIARKHMSSTVSMRVQDTITDLIAIATGKRTTPKEKTLKYLDKRLGFNGQLDPGTASEKALEIIEKSLGRHFQSTAPKGLNKLLNEIHTGTRSMTEILKDISELPNISLSNHYSLYEANESEFLNEKYDFRNTGERYQPNLKNSKYINTEFLSRVGAKVDSEGNIIKDNNNKYQQAYDTYIDFQLENMALYNTGPDLSVYDKINVRQSSLDRLTNLVKGKDSRRNVKEWAMDMIKFRIDEEEIGNVGEDGKTIREKTSMKTFPKPYIRKLEDSSTRTEDNLFALATFTKASHMYDSRTRYFGDITALQKSMIDRGSIDGKAAAASNSFKMLSNYIDSNFFGINETANKKVKLPIVGEVDIAKVFSKLHEFIRWKNLSYNVIVPATSYFTSRIGLYIEQATGQYIDDHSVKLARASYRTNLFGATKEAFTLDSKNYLNVLGEHLGFFDYANRFENAGRSKTARFFSKMGFGLHTAANFEPLSLAMMSNLYGHRVYDNKVVDFNTYRKLTGKTAKEAKPGWEALKDKTFAKYIKVDGTKVTYDYLAFQKDTNIATLAEAQSKFNESLLAVRNRGKKLIERIDGTIKSEERTMLQRNFFGKFAMTHKGWLAIALANKFKYKHFNFQTMMEEEGSYITGARQITKALKEAFMAMRGKGDFKKAWAELTGSESEDYVKQNMKRNLVEFSVATTIFAIASLMAGIAGDDDNDDYYALQLTTYMLERINNEQNSQQLGLYSEVYKSIESPIVGITQIVDMFKVGKIFDGSPKNSGRYNNVPVNLAYAIDNVAPMKQFYQLMNTDNIIYQKNAYQYFNSLDNNQPLAWVFSSEDFANLVRGYK